MAWTGDKMGILWNGWNRKYWKFNEPSYSCIGISVCLAHKMVVVFQTSIWSSGHRDKLKFHSVDFFFSMLTNVFPVLWPYSLFGFWLLHIWGYTWSWFLSLLLRRMLRMILLHWNLCSVMSYCLHKTQHKHGFSIQKQLCSISSVWGCRLGIEIASGWERLTVTWFLRRAITENVEQIR